MKEIDGRNMRAFCCLCGTDIDKADDGAAAELRLIPLGEGNVVQRLYCHSGCLRSEVVADIPLWFED
ncbi:hypothetical protein [Streptomyces boluensis]|uniref:Uncharacterized protein n=1 Tax=Streptomyces boluensis TaxID=1775135 RepID=A0A964XPH3_9ACTN|nr:hypothetical protein [Streptomyces boluensis]NBE54772.1 hypothetical protein [Streptomyces boluensis]